MEANSRTACSKKAVRSGVSLTDKLQYRVLLTCPLLFIQFPAPLPKGGSKASKRVRKASSQNYRKLQTDEDTVKVHCGAQRSWRPQRRGPGHCHSPFQAPSV
ncbi:hypothetical protein PAMP_006436 [Pampus punctatissimus]